MASMKQNCPNGAQMGPDWGGGLQSSQPLGPSPCWWWRMLMAESTKELRKSSWVLIYFDDSTQQIYDSIQHDCSLFTCIISHSTCVCSWCACFHSSSQWQLASNWAHRCNYFRLCVWSDNGRQFLFRDNFEWHLCYLGCKQLYCRGWISLLYLIALLQEWTNQQINKSVHQSVIHDINSTSSIIRFLDLSAVISCTKVKTLTLV